YSSARSARLAVRPGAMRRGFVRTRGSAAQAVRTHPTLTRRRSASCAAFGNALPGTTIANHWHGFENLASKHRGTSCGEPSWRPGVATSKTWMFCARVRAGGRGWLARVPRIHASARRAAPGWTAQRPDRPKRDPQPVETTGADARIPIATAVVSATGYRNGVPALHELSGARSAASIDRLRGCRGVRP